MALHAKDRSPIRLSVELSPALYQAILEMLEKSETSMSVVELFEALEDQLGGALSNTVAEATGVTAPFPQGVDVEIVSDDDEPDPVEGFRQAWHDAMTGNTHPASILWDDSFWDEPDDE